MEFWNDIITEKSQKTLLELAKKTNFVLIGGWASWLYSKSIKSKDIDIYIDFKDFFTLQKFFLEQGINVVFNQKLNKYEIKIQDIDLDIYTPDHCNLAIPCKDVFKNRLFKDFGNFKVVFPEVLLLLKVDAEKNRHDTVKGFKDRVDILSLLYSTNLNKKLLKDLANQYRIELIKIKDIIEKSTKEYSYFFGKSENLRELKKFKQKLLQNFILLL
jgi:hypothetical protein